MSNDMQIIKIGQMVAAGISNLSSFQDGRHSPSWIYGSHFGITNRVFGGLYHCAKYSWNLCSGFDSMEV